MGRACNLERLVAEFFCCPAGVNQEWKRGAPAIPARKNIDMKAARSKCLRQSDGQRRLARAAG
jgi:hypothetical protein